MIVFYKLQQFSRIYAMWLCSQRQTTSLYIIIRSILAVIMQSTAFIENHNRFPNVQSGLYNGSIVMLNHNVVKTSGKLS